MCVRWFKQINSFQLFVDAVSDACTHVHVSMPHCSLAVSWLGVAVFMLLISPIMFLCFWLSCLSVSGSGSVSEHVSVCISICVSICVCVQI